jgi:hypothetical protein
MDGSAFLDARAAGAKSVFSLGTDLASTRQFNSIGRVDVQGSRKNFFNRKDGITVKRLLELAIICGFLFVLVGCSDTQKTTKGATGGGTASKAETKATTKP